MRLAAGLIAAAVILSGCTSTPLDGMNRIAFSGDAEPLPADYREILRHHYGLHRAPDLQVSAPRQLISETVGQPARWYVCVRSPSGPEAVHILSHGQLAGTLPAPAPDLCAGGVFTPLG